MKLWNDRENLGIFAIIEIRKDGKCGIVMTGFSRHLLVIAVRRMERLRKQPRTSLEVIKFAEIAE